MNPEYKDSWELFMQSGRIDDYLQYKQQQRVLSGFTDVPHVSVQELQPTKYAPTAGLK